MSDYKSIKTEELTKIANAIRYKTGKSDKISLEAMAKKIREIEGGVSLPELENEGSAADLLSGKELINSDGNIVTGTIETKNSSNLAANGATVTVPAGYYATQATKSVATVTQTTPSISIDSAGKITATATQTAGYVEAGTKFGTKQLTTQAAKTITPSTSSQTAVNSGVYTTGKVTVNPIPSNYIVPSGTKTITTNGTHDVKSYASATVSVAGEDVTSETSAYTSKLATLETAITALEAELQGKASGGSGGSVETISATITTLPEPGMEIYYIDGTMTLQHASILGAVTFEIAKGTIFILTSYPSSVFDSCPAVVGNGMCKGFLAIK